jgi:hypothetical protein
LSNQQKAVSRQIEAIRKSLSGLSTALRRLDRPLQALVGAHQGPAPARAKRALSPQRRAALKLHGRYLGHTRLLKPRQKAEVKALRATKGIHAAIALAVKLSKGSPAR